MRIKISSGLGGEAEGRRSGGGKLCGSHGKSLWQSLRDADVIALYLSNRGNERLRKKLERGLKRGARVVSHRWPFIGWKAAGVDEDYKIYLYKIGIER